MYFTSTLEIQTAFAFLGFFLIGINHFPRAKKGAVILKEQFPLYKKRAEMDKKVMQADNGNMKESKLQTHFHFVEWSGSIKNLFFYIFLRS